MLDRKRILTSVLGYASDFLGYTSEGQCLVWQQSKASGRASDSTGPQAFSITD